MVRIKGIEKDLEEAQDFEGLGEREVRDRILVRDAAGKRRGRQMLGLMGRGWGSGYRGTSLIRNNPPPWSSIGP